MTGRRGAWPASPKREARLAQAGGAALALRGSPVAGDTAARAEEAGTDHACDPRVAEHPGTARVQDLDGGAWRAELAWIETRRSRFTRAAYRRDLRTWAAWCSTAGADPRDPAPEQCAAFRDAILAERAPLSVRRALSTLSSVWTATRHGERNPFSERSLPRPPASSYSRTEAVPDAEARRLVEAAGSRGEAPLRDRALLLVLWATGMRRSSATSAARAGLFDRDGVAILRHRVKGGAEVESELTPEAAGAVRAWLAEAPKSKWVFCRLDGGALSAQSVTRIVAAAAKAAGVRAHPHMLRASFVTRALDAGVALERVQRAAHHSDPRSTQRYDRGRRGAGVVAEVAALREGGAAKNRRKP